MTDTRKYYIVLPHHDTATVVHLPAEIVYGTLTEAANYADKDRLLERDVKMLGDAQQDNVNFDALIENAVNMFGLMQKQAALLTDVLRVVASRLPKNR